MACLSIQLPQEVEALAKARAQQAGHVSLDAYVESLIRADAVEDHGTPRHLSVQPHEHNEHLVELLREGEASPAREMTPGDWNALRRQLVERRTQSKAG